MYLKNPLLFSLMAILLLGGTITPAISQSSPEFGIVINEVELNPKGSDAGYGSGGSGINSKTTTGLSGAQEYVELYNTSDETIDISGWSIVPSATWKSLVIPSNTLIEPNSFLAFTYVNFWFKDFGETVTLVDDMGNVIDETPLLKDNDDESTTWQRITDGIDTDSASDWELKRMTPKSSNGKIIETQDTTFTFNASLDKTEYVFGETFTISGNVSEKLSTTSSTTEIVKISIQGPNYFKNLALFPDTNLNFSYDLKIQKVLGFDEGNYTVDISYGGHIINTNFKIIDELSSISDDSISETLEIFTEKESYIPGETVIMHADTNSSIEFGGLDYTVSNPNGEIVFAGTIFPNERFSTVYQAGAGQIYPFSTQMYMGTVNPVYGEYEIQGIFKSQNSVGSEENITASATFNLAEDVKEDVSISISTDKELYSISDIVTVSGRSNQIWTETLQLDIQQTGVLSRDTSDVKGMHFRPDPFILQESIRLNGDGTFKFEFPLVSGSLNYDSDEYSHVLGDYRVKVSSYHGENSIFFKVVEDPESFVDVRTPLGLKSDKSEVILGTAITFSGKIMDYEQSGNQRLEHLEFTFYKPDGKPVMSEDRSTSFNDYGKSPNAPLTIRSIPDSLGTYEANLIIYPIQFDHGTYTVKVKHPFTKMTESLEFEVKSAQSEILPETNQDEPLTIKICKSTRDSSEEILKDLKTIGKGEIPPSMESIDCNHNQKFSVGEKLVVTGKVIPKTGRTLDQSSTITSAQTQEGSSYATNYAESIMNYVEVSIPYPTSMLVTKSSAWHTTPNEGENYTGGGGSGNQGSSYYVDKDGNVVRPDKQCEASGTSTCSGTSRSDHFGEGSYDGTAVLQTQKKLLTDMNYKAYPDKDGNFATIFELRAGVFNSGTYSVKAHYFGYHDETTVVIIDDSLQGGQEPKIELLLMKDEFVPGETVAINGLIKNIYYFDSVSVKIETPDVSKISCFAGQQCGLGNTEKKLRVQETVQGPKFSWNYKIPSTSPVGEYKIIVDTHFADLEKKFFVVDNLDVIGKQETSTKKIIEKFNRISDNEISITLDDKSSEESVLVPRVLQGSLFTSARGEESNVNLRITTNDGQCIVGQDSNCLVSESTRKPGEIYSIVSIDDVNYKIRYSGNDVRLEKFSIVPEESNSQIDVENWKVEVIKDEQPTRFYYKVSYIALE